MNRSQTDSPAVPLGIVGTAAGRAVALSDGRVIELHAFCEERCRQAGQLRAQAISEFWAATSAAMHRFPAAASQRLLPFIGGLASQQGTGFGRGGQPSVQLRTDAGRADQQEHETAVSLSSRPHGA